MKRNGLVLFVAFFAIILAGLPINGEPPAPAVSKPAESADAIPKVLTIIPDDCVFIVSVKSVKGITDKIDKFVKEVAPEQAKDFKSLDFANLSEKMGKGFDKNGSFALVILPPEKYAPELIKKARTASGMREAFGVVHVKVASKAIDESETKPADTQPAETAPKPSDDTNDDDDKPAQMSDMPFVYIFPTTNVKKLFPDNMKIKKDGEIYILDDDGFIKVIDGHAVIASKKEYLDAFPAKNPITQNLSPSRKKLIQQNDAFFLVNVRAMNAIKGSKFNALIRGVTTSGPMGMMVSMYPPLLPVIYPIWSRRKIFDYAETLTAGVRFADTGLLAEARLTFPPDSSMGKMLLSYKAPATPAPLLTRMPKFKHMFAYGSTKTLKTPMDVKTRMIRSMFEKLESIERDSDEPLIKKETKKAVEKAMLDIQEQVTGVKHYAGRPSEEGHYFSVGTVIECKSADKLLKTIPKFVASLQKILDDIIPAVKSGIFDGVGIEYLPAEVTIGDIKADSVSLTLPRVMQGIIGQMLPNLLGENAARMLLVKVDDNTVITTVGGGEEFLTEMVKAAKGKHNIAADKKTAASLKMLPADRTAVIVVNVGNLFNQYIDMMRAMMGGMAGMGGMPAIPEYQPMMPAVVSIGADKNDMRFDLFIPTELLTELFRIINETQNAVRGSPEDEPIPPPSDEDF